MGLFDKFKKQEYHFCTECGHKMKKEVFICPECNFNLKKKEYERSDADLETVITDLEKKVEMADAYIFL